MQLRARSLSLELQGDDVKLLQSELTQLGLTISGAEVQRAMFGAGTQEAVMAFQRQHAKNGLKPTGVVDDATARLINQAVEMLAPPAPTPAPTPSASTAPPPIAGSHCVVRGTIRRADATPLASTQVAAFDQRITGPRALGQGTTDAEGTYAIAYPSETPPPGSRKGVYLFVRVLESDGSALAESPLLCDAPCEAVIDLMLRGGEYAGPSEFETVSAAITPLLESVAVPDLSKPQVVLLSCRTGLDRRLIQILVWAAKRGREQQIPPEALYGFARAGLATSLPALYATSPVVRRNALQSALADNRIPLTVRARLEAIEQSMLAAAARYLGDNTGRPAQATVSPILAAAGLSSDEQTQFLAHQVTSRGSAEALWAAVAKDPALAPKSLRLQLAIQVAAITRNHAPLINAILGARQGQIAGARDLAKLPLASWQSLIASSGVPEDVPGADAATKASNYAKTIVRTLEVLFPTPTFAARLKSDSARPNPAMSRFFDQNPDFELRDTHVDAYLAEHSSALAGAEKPDELLGGLRRLQRVLRLTPRYDDAQHLMEQGIASARDIVAMGRSAFLQAHGEAIGVARATDIYDRARQVDAVAALLFARHSPRMNAIDLRVTANPAGTGA